MWNTASSTSEKLPRHTHTQKLCMTLNTKWLHWNVPELKELLLPRQFLNVLSTPPSSSGGADSYIRGVKWPGVRAAFPSLTVREAEFNCRLSKEKFSVAWKRLRCWNIHIGSTSPLPLSSPKTPFLKCLKERKTFRLFLSPASSVERGGNSYFPHDKSTLSWLFVACTVNTVFTLPIWSSTLNFTRLLSSPASCWVSLLSS